MNLPPTADTIRYTQLVNTPHDLNVSLATSDPNGDPLTISLVGDSTAGGNLTVIRTGNGAYTITGTTPGTYTIEYQVCDTDQYAVHVLCDTSVIIATIISPVDTLTPLPPVANNDHASTTGAPAVINVRGNDSDPMGHPLTTPVLVTSTTTPDGNWTVDANGNVVFTPNTGLTPGIYYDSVQYQVCDVVYPTLCTTAWAIVTTTVVDTAIANRAPVAVDDHVTTPMGTPVVIVVRHNDSDPDGDALTLPTVIVGPSVPGSSYTVNNDGTVTYVPNPYVYSINGQPVDSFEYMICDTNAAHAVAPLCDTAWAFITIVPMNLPPTADTIRYTEYDSIAHDVNVILATSDPNGDPLTITVLPGSDPSLHIVRTGNGAYTITGDSIGTFTIEYQVCDTDQYAVHVLCDTSVIIATIISPADTLVNHPPVAVNDHATTTGTTPATVNVRGNDSDPDHDPLTMPILVGSPTNPSLGTFVVNNDGTVTFTPSGGLPSGIYIDSIMYSVCDSGNTHLVPSPLCTTAWLIITINNTDTAIANRAPVAVDDHVTTQPVTPVVISVRHNDSDPDGDALTLPTVIVGPVNGTETVNADGTVTYTPYPGVYSTNGMPADSFEYTICDTNAAHAVAPLCDTAWVYITIPAGVKPVVAVNDTVYTHTGVHDTICVVCNDTFSHCTTPVVTIVHNPIHGTVSIADSNAVYTSNAGYVGIDSFMYKLCMTCAGVTSCDTAEVYVHIDSFCKAPVAMNDSVIHGYVCNDTIHVTLNDTLTVGATLHIINHSMYGVATVSGLDIVYAPDGNSPNVTDTVVYALCSTCGACDTAILSIHLNSYPCNVHHPVAINDSVTICKNNIDSAIYVLANDYDPDGGSVSIDTSFGSYTNGSNGTIAIHGNHIAYVPNFNFVGQDRFTYTVCDNGTPKLCVPAFVIVTVNECSPNIHLDTLIRDTTTACQPITINLDSINQAAGYNVYFAGFCDSAHHGTLTRISPDTTSGVNGSLVFQYQPNGTGDSCYVGNDTMCLIICNTGIDTVCTTTHIIVTVLPKPLIDSVWAHDDADYTCQKSISIHVLRNDGFIPFPGNSQTGTHKKIVALLPVAGVMVTGDSVPGYTVNGDTIYIAKGDSTITFKPSNNAGIDTFRYIMSTDGNTGLTDTATVYVYVCTPPHVEAVNDCKGDTTTTVDVAAIINVLANDSLQPANDTTVAIAIPAKNGKLVVNANHTITYTPDSAFHGTDGFTYVVCEIVGDTSICDSAFVCINVVDTVTPCFFPNGFSPNGDGVNDAFMFPCATRYPNAVLKVFNRWGDAIYQSAGGYNNDWKGTNQSGDDVPDGTYYFIYEYNDGSGKSEARFVVLHRGDK